MNREGFGVSTRTVGGTEQLKGAFPRYHLPQVPSNGNGEWGVIFQYGISLTFVGLIESVMTLQACDEITETLPSVFRSNQECVAQGIANAVSGLFGAMGGDAMIGQSTINISVNGARGRLSGATAGILMLFFVVALSPVISTVPIGTLTGVLFMVVLSTFNWQTFPMLASHVLPESLLKCVERVAGPLPRIPKADAFVIVLTTVLAVYFNLAVGVVVGTVVLSTFDAWNRGARFQVVKGTNGPGLRRVPAAAAPLLRHVQGLRAGVHAGRGPAEVRRGFIKKRGGGLHGRRRARRRRRALREGREVLRDYWGLGRRQEVHPVGGAGGQGRRGRAGRRRDARVVEDGAG